MDAKTHRQQLFLPLSTQNYFIWVASNQVIPFLPRTTGIVPKGKNVNKLLIKIEVLNTCSKSILFALTFGCFISELVFKAYVSSF